MANLKSISQREKELFSEAYRLRNANFEITKVKGNKNKQYKQCRELQKKESELHKKQQFFKNYIKEMEKRKDD